MKRTKYASRNIREGYLLIAPLLAGALLFYAAPFLLVLRNSVFRGISHSEQFVGLQNFRDIPANEVFRLAFGNTLKFLLVSIPLIIIISFAVALLLRGQAQKHETLKSVLLLPYIMPVAGTVMLIQLLFAQTGVLNQGLYTLGLPVTDWLQSEHAFGVVVLLYLWKNMGYSVILLLSGLVTLSPEHDQAAELDGSGSGTSPFPRCGTASSLPRSFLSSMPSSASAKSSSSAGPIRTPVFTCCSISSTTRSTI